MILKQNIELNFPAVVYVLTLIEGIGNPVVGIRKMETDTGNYEKMEQGRVSIKLGWIVLYYSSQGNK